MKEEELTQLLREKMSGRKGAECFFVLFLDLILRYQCIFSRLKKAFPLEHAAIDTFFEHLSDMQGFDLALGVLKLMPLWMSEFVVKTGIVNLFTKLWNGPYKMSTKDIVFALTDNPDLRVVLCYCWGDYGTPPSRSHFLAHVSLDNEIIDHLSFTKAKTLTECYNVPLLGQWRLLPCGRGL